MAESSAIHEYDGEYTVTKRKSSSKDAATGTDEMGAANQGYEMDDDNQESDVDDNESTRTENCSWKSEVENEISEKARCIKLAVWCAPCLQFLSNQKGVLYTLIAALLSALGSMGVASLSGSVSPNEINFIRMFIQLLSCLPITVHRRTPFRFPRNAYLLLLLRCIVGSVNSALVFLTYQIMPVANAKSIQYSSPIFAGLLGWILLKESCSVVDTVLSFVTLAGVFLVAQPPFIFGNVESVETVSDAGIIGSIISVFVAILSALIMIILRKLSTYGMPSLTFLTVYSVVGMIISAAMTSILRQWTIPGCGLDRIALIGNGILLVITQILVYIALKTERASNVALVLSSDVLFTFILEFIFFGIVPNYITVIGTIVIIASFVGLTLKKLCTGKDVLEDSEEESESNTVRSRHVDEQEEQNVGLRE